MTNPELSGDLDAVVTGLFKTTLTLSGKRRKPPPESGAESREGYGLGSVEITPDTPSPASE